MSNNSNDTKSDLVLSLKRVRRGLRTDVNTGPSIGLKKNFVIAGGYRGNASVIGGG